MNEHDPLIERLRGLGHRAIDPVVAARHRAAMAVVPARTTRFVKLKVGAAFTAGLVLGGTGLASAGALPGPVQAAAHGALSQVGVSVPNGHKGHGPARYNGPECTGGPYANHGQYVRAHKSDPNAGQSRCGKPVQAGNDGSTNGTEAPEAPETPGNDQGGAPGAAHNGHGHGGDEGATPSTTIGPGKLNPSPSTSTSTSTSSVPATSTIPSTSSTTAL